MVYKLRPLELALEFEDRPYKLGDTIYVRLDLKPNGDVSVREVRVDLECQQRYWESSTLTMEVPVIIHSLQGGEGVSAPRQTGTDTVVKQVSKELKESFMHSSVEFLNGETLRMGSPRTAEVKLEIEPVPPPHAAEAKELVKDSGRSWSFNWTLIAEVNVVRGRNPKQRRVVRIAIE